MTNITPLDFDGNRRESERRLHFRSVSENGHNYTGVGSEFAIARQQSGLDFVAVAQRLRIRRDYLSAIEEGRFSDLPAPAYAIGFVRSYAEFLGLDSAVGGEQFKNETESSTQRLPLIFPSVEPGEHMPKGWLIGMSVVLAAVVFGAWYYSENADRFVVNRVPPAPTTQVTPEGAGDAGILPLASVAEVAVAAPVVLKNVPAALPLSAPLPAVVGEFDPAIGHVLGVIPARPVAPVIDRDVLAAVEPALVPPADPAPAPIPNEEVLAALIPAVESQPVGALPPPVAAPGEERIPAGAGADNQPGPVPALGVPAIDLDAAIGEAAPAAVAIAELRPAIVPEPVPPPVVEPASPAAVKLEPAPVQPAVPEPAEMPAAGGVAVAALPEAVGPAPVPLAARALPLAAPADVAVLAGGRTPEVFGAENTESRVTIRAHEDSWVQLTGAAGELLLTRILRAGDIYRAPNRDDLVLMTGNAGALEITVDGIQVSSLGPVGSVRRNVSLAPDRLLAGIAVAR